MSDFQCRTDPPPLRHPRRLSAGIHLEKFLTPYASGLTAPLQENTHLRIDVLLPDVCLLCLLAAVDINQVVINKLIE
jgi:hypothetical protein